MPKGWLIVRRKAKEYYFGEGFGRITDLQIAPDGFCMCCLQEGMEQFIKSPLLDLKILKVIAFI